MLVTYIESESSDPAVKTLQYADDIVIYTNVYPVDNGLSLLKTDLEHKASYLNNIGLSVSAEKTQLCVFSHKDKENQIIERNGRKRKTIRNRHSIAFQNSCIWDSLNVIFLGMKLNSALAWGPQIQSTLVKCLTPIKIINCLRGIWWGADPILLINLYRTLIRSRLDYGTFLLHNLNKTQVLLFDRLQWRALRLALGCRMSTPTNVILAEACEPPLNLRSIYLGLNFLTRVHMNPNHPLIDTLNYIKDSIESPIVNVPFKNLTLPWCLGKMLGIIPLVESNTIPCCYSSDFETIFFTPSVDLDTSLKFNSSNNYNSEFNLVFKQVISDCHCFYTDG